MYIASVGAFGNLLSVAILFLEVQSAHVKPAKMNIINLLGKGPLPCSQDQMKYKRDFGILFHLKTSLIMLQDNLPK